MATADIVIIGAGAAGLAAAIFSGEAAGPSDTRSIVLLDGAKTIGAKILVSGGGRCNVTHEVVAPTDFFGNRRIIKNVLAAWPVESAITWFASMGVELKREETGKLFPVTNTSRTVLNALVERCRELGVAILPDHRVAKIDRLPDSGAGFVVHHSHGAVTASRVILATGGRSIPKSGSDGFGYELARSLGHQVTPTVPALVPLVLDDRMFHKHLSGLSQEVELTTVVKGKMVDARIGSLLWTHFGISGPVVMDASRFWCVAQEQGESAEVFGNFWPGQNQEQVRQWFMEQTREHPRRSLGKTLAQRLPQRFTDFLIQHAGCDSQAAIAQLPKNDRDHLLSLQTKFLFPIVQDRGWNYAEVTAGGVPLEEVNFRTMESKLVPGLYLVGEILDCDGRIGGFNFQWAWATGHLAGQAVRRPQV
ncbi:NAD(P)/FAD-dependent oxidoreductase [Nitrospira lenta]|uniref:Putative Oxidoreductase with FAD/NAD(P)-binding domain n=1 Tax=Nitrospira lenta TaxID=1436998 RepID=A0A330LCA5_9BACT|nr:NAD(P)/FAD-dependent oxidoreductase [Nitrospira lenta]SPP64649.1 putative Oxidoreductase with FAD/NAD(P)-binding domain [Nitrospira lenta]